jgi:hypothetical protein
MPAAAFATIAPFAVVKLSEHHQAVGVKVEVFSFYQTFGRFGNSVLHFNGNG